jgi:hypothetical protein
VSVPGVRVVGAAGELAFWRRELDARVRGRAQLRALRSRALADRDRALVDETFAVVEAFCLDAEGENLEGSLFVDDDGTVDGRRAPGMVARYYANKALEYDGLIADYEQALRLAHRNVSRFAARTRLERRCGNPMPRSGPPRHEARSPAAERRCRSSRQPRAAARPDDDPDLDRTEAAS